MKKTIVFAAIAALSFAASASAQQVGDGTCWQAFKKNLPQCAQKSRQEKGGSMSVSDVARRDFSNADTKREDRP